MLARPTTSRIFSILFAAMFLLAGAAWTLQPASPAYALSWTNRTTADGLGSNSVRGVYVSGSTVYAATDGGLSISTDGGASFTNKTTADGLGSNDVHGVHASGSMVYAATEGGLSISTNGGVFFANRTTADGLGHNRVLGVHASGSNVYAATNGGLSISTDGGASFANKTTTDGLGHNYVLGVYVSGWYVYAATFGGLSISTNGGISFTNKTTADGLGGNWVHGVHASGLVVYAATFGGLAITTNGGISFSDKTTADGLGSNLVYDVYASGSTVYAATEGGLSISTDGGASFTNKTTADGLGDNRVHGVYASGSTVYAATWGGLSYASTVVSKTFKSAATQDGWILESSETSGKGGKLNKGATTLRVGDDAANKQCRAILSFDTSSLSSLPEGAEITSVTLQFKYAGKKGTLPFNTHGKLLVDVINGSFSNDPALQKGDFQFKGSKNNLFVLTKKTVDGWYIKVFAPTQFQYINTAGVTQFRLRFKLDDNNDFGADFLKIYSGDAVEADRPQLIVEYELP
jgi:hypothetical protein